MLISILITVVVGLVYFYLQLPALNLHSAEFYAFVLLLCAVYNNTAYYPSTADLQSSLNLANSCSSEFTLRTMAYVSILVPFVLAYIIYAWRAIDRKPITAKELEQDGHAY